MQFCDCGSILVPGKDENDNTVMKCNSCGKIISVNKGTNEAFEVKKTIRHKDSEKTVIIDKDDQDFNSMPTAKAVCNKCGHNEAVYWFLQTRSGDEATTTFYRCKKCSFTWRDYG